MEIHITELDHETIHELLDGYSTDECKFVYKTQWDEGGKYSYQTVYFVQDDTLCSIDMQRSGSWFSEYHTEVSGYTKGVDKRELLLSLLSSSSKLKNVVEAIYNTPDDAIAILDNVLAEVYPPKSA